ncbi:PAS domain S-box-containing protein/diguanylate cyclase (GGDEF) domain-containing protein [Ectothiorhodospira marina]|uniref:PAS domain S-box-containing protein/diguanylate cyclase (GGDEF) domain-containing protein n=1 Tax=Ectothiorhodospira marina TaxID=1396821 RepID=A0A1H7RE87_9GAMM|nr:PAS domain S-box-containing protein/diguanylate cyclase (GGDEF) domain-containing protein [Ectothiorhodospira marina]
MNAYTESSTTRYCIPIRAIPLPALLVDAKGGLLDANPELRKCLGLEDDPGQWPDLSHFLLSLEPGELQTRLRQCPHNGEAVEHRVRCRNAQGQPCEAILHMAGLGNGLYLCTFTRLHWMWDSHKEQPDARGLEAQRWRFAVHGAGDGVWDWDVATNEVAFCHRFAGILGYTDRELDHSFDQWLKLVHPDDLRRFSAELQAHLQGDHDHHAAEYRMRHREGHWVWVMSRGRAISRDARNHPRRVVGTLSDIADRKQIEEELRRMATTDFLTGLPNRRHFLSRIEDELARVKRKPEQGGAVLMLDLDHFKGINDVYGHSTGDAVLRHFASVFSSALRQMDLAARMGGEEFAALLPGTHLQDARVLAERLRRRIKSTPAVHQGAIMAVTVSIGVAELHPEDGSSDDTLHRADAALYRAKGDGRNRVEVARPPGEEGHGEDFL